MYQLGFRPHRSIETVLVKVINDLLLGSDQSCDTVLEFTESSAAFHINYQTPIPLDRLRNVVEVGGTAISWLRTYMPDNYEL